MMTPEQTAIRQFLSKPLPSNGGCGCMGPQSLDPDRFGRYDPGFEQYEMKILDAGPNRVNVLKEIRRFLSRGLEYQIGLFDSKLVMEGKPFKSAFEPWRFRETMESLGASLEIKQAPSNLYPYCPCMMCWVETVDNNFYMITENRSVDGVTHSATLVGPVGGPYIK